MRVLHYSDWDKLELRNVDPPEPGPGEVLIRVSACGICGSEIEAVIHRTPRRTPPLILGHEFCGVVEGSGRRVVANAVLSCGACEACRADASNLCAQRVVFGMQRPGAFAEFVTAPSDHLFDWPNNLPAASACLAEPLANGVHVAKMIQAAKPDSVVILGAGSIGLMCLQSIRSRIPSVSTIVADFDEDRLAVAARLGADETLKPDAGTISSILSVWGSRFGGHVGADVVVDAAGVGASKRLSIEITRPGGQTVWIGLGENEISLPTFPVTVGERAILGSYAATSADIAEALHLMATNAVDVSSWITTFEPDRWVEGFYQQLEPKTRSVKAVLVNV